MRFRLVRYFTIASLAAFVVVTAVLGYAQRQLAIDNMIELEQNNNVNLTKTFANSLWDEFLPFVRRAGGQAVEQLRADPQQQLLFKEVVDLMRGLSVVKVKVYDLNGLTVFSTQASQIGEDKSGNGGFLAARGGINASELTHRDSFSAFEETVENLDVLSSYIPIVSPRTGQIEGVFEIYSDVTPFLASIDRMTWLVVSLVVGALGALFLVLFLVVRRADGIIKSQADENARAQLQVAQNEKMASLGQMVAGVAHELNTPLAFTRSNLSMLRDLVDEIRLPLHWGGKLIAKLREAGAGDVNLKIKLSEGVHRQFGEFDEDLSPDQLKEMLSESLMGLDQMAELVVNLKEFTRLDRAKVADFDVNRGLDNVLYIAGSAIHEKVTIVKQLGEVPSIRCMPSQINQIFINLITNAAQAITDTGEIRVRTAYVDGHVKVEVEDTGQGIAEDVLPHIFDAFYTTKAAGEGTGLGLSITRDIVQEHGGQIFVDSKPGAGTRFTVLLPVEPAIEQPLAA